MDAVGEREPADSDEAQQREAIRSAGSRLRQLMARVPWAVVSPSWLEAIQAAYDPVIAAMESYASSEQDVAFLTTWREIDRMWASLGPLVAAGIPEESVSEDAAMFRRSTGQMTRRLAEHVDELEGEAARLREQLETVSNERHRALAEIKEQQSTLQTTIQDQAGRLDAAISQYESQFSDLQSKHQEAIDAAISTNEEALKTYFAGWQSKGGEILEGAQSRANEMLLSIENLEEKATESYNTIGTASAAAYYQKDANDEQKQARLWRWAAVGAFLLVALGTIAELLASGGSVEWEQTRSRIPVVIGLFAFSGFAVAESRAHRKAERESRDREVKLSSIDPYLILVGDAESPGDKLKLDYARKLFLEAQSDGADSDSDDQDDDD